MSEINDRRSEEDKARTIGFVVATDSFMSGWGKAPGRSYYAVPFASDQEADTVERNLRARREMKRVRVVYGRTYRPRLREGDHLSIAALSGPWAHTA